MVHSDDAVPPLAYQKIRVVVIIIIIIIIIICKYEERKLKQHWKTVIFVPIVVIYLPSKIKQYLQLTEICLRMSKDDKYYSKAKYIEFSSNTNKLIRKVKMMISVTYQDDQKNLKDGASLIWKHWNYTFVPYNFNNFPF